MTTLESFDWDAFNVEEPTDDLGLQIELDPGGNSLPGGIYMLYLRNMIIRDENRNVTFELWYISMDGRQHGRLLSMRGDVNLISVTRDPLDKRLMLAQVSEDLVKAWDVDWGTATVEGYVASGIRGLSKEPRFHSLNVSPQSTIAFSPDGHWLVWNCEPEGVLAYCLLDLEEGAGMIAYPEGDYSGPNFMEGFYSWSPDDEWFLAFCNTRLVNPDWNGGRCLVWPKQGAIEWQKSRDWMEDKDQVSFIRSHSIAPDGNHLFIVQFVDVDEGEKIGQLVVLDQACLLSELCEKNVVVEFPPGEGWEAVWSFSGKQLALSYSPFISDSSHDPGLTTVVAVNVADGSSQVVADGVYNGADVIGWSPDGEWIVTNCGDRHPYAVCLLSTDGFFRPLVPDYEGSRQEFLGWLVVP